MGNCFANYFQAKGNSSTTTSNQVVVYNKCEGGETTKKKTVPKERSTSVRTGKFRDRKRNRVQPGRTDSSEDTCGRSLPNSSHFIYPVSDSSRSSIKSDDSSESIFEKESVPSSCSSTSYKGNPSRATYTVRAGSRTPDSLSSSSCSSDTQDYESSTEDTSSAEAKPGVTQGRLIIVQPYRSFSHSYSSFERIQKTHKVAKILGRPSDVSSFDSFSDNTVDFDEFSSEEESCKVFPSISK